MIMLDEIAKILSEQLGIPQSKVTLESRIVEDLGADSLARQHCDCLFHLKNHPPFSGAAAEKKLRLPP